MTSTKSLQVFLKIQRFLGRWLTLKNSREHRRFIEDCYSAEHLPILCGFLFLFVVIAVNGDGVLALERFAVAPLDAYRPHVRLIYCAFMGVCLSGAAGSMGLGWYCQKRRRSAGSSDEGRPVIHELATDDAERNLDAGNAAAVRLLRWLLIALRLAFVMFSIYLFRLSHASGWTLHYVYVQMQTMSVFNGLTFRQNFFVLVLTAVMVMPNVIGPKPR